MSMSDPQDDRVGAFIPSPLTGASLPDNVRNYTAQQMHQAILTALRAGIPTPSVFTGGVGPVGIVGNLLATYTPNTDIVSGVALVANTWTNVGAATPFTAAATRGVVQVAVSGSMIVGTASGQCAARVMIGGSAFMLGGGYIATGAYANPFSGAGPVLVNSITPGSYTVQVQVLSTVANTAYLRNASNPTVEFLNVTITEWRA